VQPETRDEKPISDPKPLDTDLTGYRKNQLKISLNLNFKFKTIKKWFKTVNWSVLSVYQYRK
jgi:hypothetical protein